MTARQMKSLQRQLEAKQTELEQRIHRMRDRLAISERGDDLELVQSITEREFAANDLALHIRRLEGVREALREIRVGTFGRCAACDHEIPLRRLQAVPWSPYCIQCQEGAEVRRGPGRQAEAAYSAQAG